MTTDQEEHTAVQTEPGGSPFRAACLLVGALEATPERAGYLREMRDCGLEGLPLPDRVTSAEPDCDWLSRLLEAAVRDPESRVWRAAHTAEPRRTRLLEDLKRDPHPLVRAQVAGAAFAAEAPGTACGSPPPERGRLLARLAEPDAQERAEALAALAPVAKSHPEVGAHLERCAEDPSGLVRWGAARALGRSLAVRPESVVPLLRLARDPSPLVPREAAIWLDRRGPGERQRLAEATENGPPREEPSRGSFRRPRARPHRGSWSPPASPAS